jgi:hypothetical protein
MQSGTRRKSQPRKRKLRAAIIGTGFVGRIHVEGVRRLGTVEVAAIAASGPVKSTLQTSAPSRSFTTRPPFQLFFETKSLLGRIS